MPLTLEIVTPAERVLSTQCDEVRLTASTGGLGIKPGHTPLAAVLVPGELAIVEGGNTRRYAVGEGFVEVSADHVRVLVEEAIRAEDVDLQKTVAELTERRQRLASMKPDDPSFAVERAQVERAAARAVVAGRR